MYGLEIRIVITFEGWVVMGNGLVRMRGRFECW